MIRDFVDVMANIEYGLLIAILVDASLLLVIAAVNPKKKFNVLSYIIAAILLVPLTFQMSNLIGACWISDTVDSVTELVGAFSPTLGDYVSSVTSNDVGWFVFRRILWSVLFMAIATFVICVTMEKKRTRERGVLYNSQTSRRYVSNTSKRRR